MCGFVGFTGTTDDSAVITRMMDRIAHRGPDEAEHYSDGDVSLGFRRLSIIDLECGHQPMVSKSGDVVLVFNGEIYNFQALREELTACGHTFSTNSDTEVLLHGYEEYGTDLPAKLRGMFAFVIWDKRRRQLFGVRDFFGIKPLYYATVNDRLLFASEIKAFFEHPDFHKELNEEALENYLSFQYSPGTNTFFKNVYKLPPAHYFLYTDDGMTVHRYWEPRFDADDSKTLDDWVDAIDNVMADSIKAHKISDVEVGSFLSSGVDSSYIATCADVDKTFTVGFDNGEHYNEIGYAAELSELIGTKSITHVISPDEFWENFPPIQYHMDDPPPDPAAAALFFVCRTASQHVKVALSGEGADEIFGGYNIYREPIDLTPYDKLPFALRRVIGRVAACLPAKRGLNFLVRRGQTVEERFIGNAKMFSVKERRRLLKKPVGAPPPQALCKPYYDRVAHHDDVTKMQYLDLHMWMVGDILLKADKMSMAHSLEVRVPFLDKEVMALAARIPTAYRVNAKNTKYAMRLAAHRHIPEKWAQKKKLGFPVPIRVWLREDNYYHHLKTVFTDKTAQQFFHTDRLVKMLDRHKAGKEDNSRRLWTVYSFLIWYKRCFLEDCTG